MKSILLSASLLMACIFGCNKDSKEEQNRSLLIGTWGYVSSDQSTTTFNADGSVRNVYASENIPGSITRNHIMFTTDGKAYMVEDGFGPGLSGALFVDTVSYHVTSNTILLDFPADINVHYYPNYSYPAYQDTLIIQYLSADSLSFSRRYHYKHLADSTELKESNARLRKNS